MDEFAIDSTVGQGTRVTMCKWSKSVAATPTRLVAAV
jgi:hypothetical protein